LRGVVTLVKLVSRQWIPPKKVPSPEMTHSVISKYNSDFYKTRITKKALYNKADFDYHSYELLIHKNKYKREAWQNYFVCALRPVYQFITNMVNSDTTSLLEFSFLKKILHKDLVLLKGTTLFRFLIDHLKIAKCKFLVHNTV